MIAQFEKETGIKVIYDTFDNTEIVEAKLTAGKTGYDLVVVTATFLPRLSPLNIFTKLDKSKLPNLQNACLKLMHDSQHLISAINTASIICGAQQVLATMQTKLKNA